MFKGMIMNNFTAQVIVKKPLFQASVLAAAFVLWMASGSGGERAEQADGTTSNTANVIVEKPIPQVRT